MRLCLCFFLADATLFDALVVLCDTLQRQGYDNALVVIGTHAGVDPREARPWRSPDPGAAASSALVMADESRVWPSLCSWRRTPRRLPTRARRSWSSRPPTSVGKRSSPHAREPRPPPRDVLTAQTPSITYVQMVGGWVAAAGASEGTRGFSTSFLGSIKL